MSLDQLGPSTAPDGLVLATVSLAGDLNDAAAARLLRWCEARLHLHDTGQVPIGLLAAAPPQVRQRLGRWRTFPSLDVARAALVPGGAPRPVDPDAIVLGGTTHDRLR